MTDKPLLKLSNIHKSFGDLLVLKGVNLEVQKGQVIAMIGSSGSGKSTLLRCVNLLETPQQGEIEFLDQTLSWKGQGEARRPADEAQVRALRTRMTMVFQQFNLWSHMSILGNVIEAPVTVLKQDPKQAEAKALELLDKVGIKDKADSYPAQLSGGQQQRAAIARALAMEPEAMLFDEPTSALDPELEQEVVKVIKDLAAEGRSMILVTHDMSLARDVADQVIFLHKGVIEEQGSPAELFGAPKSTRLQQFLASAGL